MRFPPPLEPGARIAVVAPASPFPREEFLAGLAWLRGRYRLDVHPGIFARRGYLAGDDARRAAELSRALVDRDTRAVVCARGGYGTLRLLDALPWDAWATAPRWIVGFSDATSLLLEAAARGVAAVHGPNVTGLARPGSALGQNRGAWLAALEHPERARAWDSLEILSAGAAAGALVGGNLTLVATMAMAGRLHLPPGSVLALEDVTERPYRIDRMLTALRLGGHLRQIAAVIFGGFEECQPGVDGVTVANVLADFARRSSIPVLAGAPFGHGGRNEAFVVGRACEVRGDRVVFAERER